MDTLLIVLLVVLIVLVLIFMGIVIFLLLKLFKDPPKGLQGQQSSSDINQIIEQAKASVAHIEQAGQKCVDHPENNAKGICSMTDDPYCELCITKEKDVRIARKHLALLLDHEWQSVHFINNEEVGMTKLNELYRVKKDIWQNEDIPLITQRQYKINIENDQVEAYTMVMGRKSDLTRLDDFLNFLD